jgi:hypothetical protein
LPVQGVVLDLNGQNGGHSLLVRYQSKDSKIHDVVIPVDKDDYHNISKNQQLQLHYFQYLPVRPVLDNETIHQTLPLVFGPFIFLAYLIGYAYLFYSLMKEFHLFKSGVLIKGFIKSISGRTATVIFLYEGKEYSVDESYVGYVDDPVFALINPGKPRSRKIYFQNSSSIFQVKY